MMNKRMILAVVVALLVIGAAWWFINDSRLRIVTKDVNYEATFEINYADGSSSEIKRYKTASIRYEGKLVDHITFDLDAKFKATQDNDVRLLSPRVGGEYETKMIFYAVDPIFGAEKISEYPLSASTNTDYSVLETGDWYNIFVNRKVTINEISDALGDVIGTQFDLRVIVHVWYNLDPEKDEVIHHELIFTVPFDIMTLTDETPGPDDGGGGSGKLDPNDPSVNPIQPYPPATDIIISDPITIQYVPWSGVKDTSANKNLGKR